MVRLPPLFLAAALMITGSASAQTTWSVGLRGGANQVSTTLNDAGRSGGIYPYSYYSADNAALYAWQAGIALEARRGNLAFQPALLFSQKGVKSHRAAAHNGIAGSTYFETTSTNRYNWLELPLNVVYTPQGGHGFQVFAGPYAAVAVGGRQRGTTRSTNNTWPGWESVPHTTSFNTKATYGVGTSNQRFDAGFNLGVGYRQGQFQMQLSYGIGLVNLRQTSEQPSSSSHNFDADVAHNRVAQLTAMYFVSR